ncbi:hypothetical protein BCT90_02915 [Vibrio lentus]|uniref:hypothetical protein n=1 Tax=Vibrio lentus TaxID=136468 RepID=UPI000C866587|nr:hypothetical protein [Vibrio lentus]PMK99875.1 hypothetical protein BCT90_02915 [Vibrio lentus]
MDNIIFIDDQEKVLKTYARRLTRLFKEVAEVVPLLPSRTVPEMLTVVSEVENVIAYIIDENLKHSHKAKYQGIELIKSIRDLDPKVPIYILTSDTSWVNPLLGDIEFVIDKVDLNKPENKDDFAKKFFRHIDTYKDIKSERAKRFDVLLAKSLMESLTDEERNEYNELNVLRSKSLLDEAIISDRDVEELNIKSKQLSELQEEIQRLVND